MSHMNTHKPIYRVVEYFGNITRAAEALGVKRQLFQAWMAQGFIPFKRGDQVEEKTGGAVKAIEIWEAAARGGK